MRGAGNRGASVAANAKLKTRRNSTSDVKGSPRLRFYSAHSYIQLLWPLNHIPARHVWTTLQTICGHTYSYDFQRCQAAFQRPWPSRRYARWQYRRSLTARAKPRRVLGSAHMMLICEFYWCLLRNKNLITDGFILRSRGSKDQWSSAVTTPPIHGEHGWIW